MIWNKKEVSQVSLDDTVQHFVSQIVCLQIRCGLLEDKLKEFESIINGMRQLQRNTENIS
jgi:hypothetical protein